MNYTLPETIINAVLKYLASKPYVEVFELVKQIQSSAVPYQAEVPTLTTTAEATPAETNGNTTSN